MKNDSKLGKIVESILNESDLESNCSKILNYGSDGIEYLLENAANFRKKKIDAGECGYNTDKALLYSMKKASKIIGNKISDETIPLLADTFKKDHYSALMAAYIIGNSKINDKARILCGAFNEDKYLRRVAACEIAKEKENAIPSLLDNIQSDDYNRVKGSLLALALISYKQNISLPANVIEKISCLTKDKNLDTKDNAYSVLERVNKQKAKELLLNDSDRPVWALQRIMSDKNPAGFDNKTLKKKLSEAVKSKDSRVSRQALSYLSEGQVYDARKLESSDRMPVLYDAKLVKSLDLKTKEALWKWKINKEIESIGEIKDTKSFKNCSFKKISKHLEYRQERLQELKNEYSPKCLITAMEKLVKEAEEGMKYRRKCILESRLNKKAQFDFDKKKKERVAVYYPKDKKDTNEIVSKSVNFMLSNRPMITPERILEMYDACKKEGLRLSDNLKIFLTYKPDLETGGQYLVNSGVIVLKDMSEETAKHEMYHNHIHNRFRGVDINKYISEGLASVYGGNHNRFPSEFIGNLPKNFKEFTKSVNKDYFFAKKFIEFCGGKELVENSLEEYLAQVRDHRRKELDKLESLDFEGIKKGALEKRGYFPGYLSRKLGYNNISSLYRKFIAQFKEYSKAPQKN